LRGFSDKDQRSVLPLGALPIWLEIAGDRSDLNVTYYDSYLRDMDATSAARKARLELLLDGFRTSSDQPPEITLLNLSHSAANARLTAYDANGEVLSRADRFYIPGRGFRNFVLGAFPEIFPGLDVGRIATLRIENISNGTGLAAGWLRRGPAGTLESFRERGPEEASDVMWAPFFVSGSDISGRWSCRITLTEWGDQDNLLHVQVYSSQGEQLGSYDRLLKAHGSWEFEIKELIGAGDESLVRGFLQIGGARGILGSISFRYESPTGSSAATIPLAPYPTNVLVFPQIVQGLSGTTQYYTGLAVLNPYELEANVTIVVVDSEGNTTAQAEFPVAPRTSSLKLLDQLFNNSFRQLGGSLRLKSTRPILSQALFGDTNGAVLAAIPPVF
jgi:hypothetical protein